MSMLRPRTLAATALVIAVSLQVSPAAFAVAPVNYNTSCAVAGVGAAGSAEGSGNNLLCSSASSTWQYPAYIMGSIGVGGTAASCTTTTAGMIQWTGSAFQGCNGSSWGPIDVSTSSALSSLLNATTTNSIDSGNFAQVWKWGTLTTQTALSFTTSSMTSGTLFNLSNSASGSNAGTVLNISNAETGAAFGVSASLTGAANTGYAGYFSNTSTAGFSIYAAGGAPATFASSVIVGPDTNNCNNARNGAIQYTSGSTNPWTYCNGSAWTPFDFVIAYSVLTASSVSIGGNFVCALKSTGALWCWGFGGNYNLGNGTTTDQAVPVQAATNFAGPWSSVSAGVNSTCAIKSSNSSAWCWGANGGGQLGNGTTTPTTTSPVAVSGSAAWLQIAAGGDGAALFNAVTYTNSLEACGVHTDNTGWCWGGNGAGNVGNGTTTEANSPVQISGSWTMIVPGVNSFTTCGVQTNGTLWCWGDNQYGQLGQGEADASTHDSPLQVGSATNWTSVAVGNVHVCALNSAGAIYCWGNNNAGQLGNNTITQETSPVQAGSATNWTSVSVGTNTGQSHTCGLQSGGAAYCWGSNLYQQLGVNSMTESFKTPTAVVTPTNVTGSSWNAIVAGYGAMTCGIRSDSTAYCWGYNDVGRLGDPNYGNYFTPVSAQ